MSFIFKSCHVPAVDKLEPYVNFKISLSSLSFYNIRVSPVLFVACKIQESI